MVGQDVLFDSLSRVAVETATAEPLPGHELFTADAVVQGVLTIMQMFSTYAPRWRDIVKPMYYELMHKGGKDDH